MKSIVFILLCAFLSSGKAAELRQIEGVTGDVYMVRFDSENYTYAVSSGPIGYPVISKFYKINSEKKLVWATHWDGSTQSIRINNQNDIYAVHILLPSEATVNVLRSGSKTFEELDRVDLPIYDFMDDEGNLFYSVGSGGIKMIRVNETTPVLIANTENFHVYDHSRYSNLVSANKGGNIYFGGCSNGGPDCKNETTEFQMIVITAEEKSKEVPKAQVIENVLQDPKNDYVIQILASYRDDILISTYNEKTENGTIEKLNNGNVTVLLSEEGFHFGKETKDRIIYQMMKRDRVELIRCAVSYLTSNDEFVPISNLQDLAGIFSCPVDFTDPDEEGDLFIGSNVELDTNPVEFLNHTESKTTSINFEDELSATSDILSDASGNLWLLGNHYEVFYVEKQTLNGSRLFQGDYLSGLKMNKNNGDLYLLGYFGLYVLVSD